MEEDSLVIDEHIGSGAYGNVYHGHWEGRRVAVKKFAVGQDEALQTAEIQHEVEILQKLADRYIIQFYGTTYHEGKLVLTMDFAEGGTLHRAINDQRVADWVVKERIAQEIARGLTYIHHKKVLHRDLKSMNVLLTRHMEVKLCDFGLATVKVRSISPSTDSAKGTVRFMAPELLQGKPVYSTKSDMYAFGMVMWEIAANCTKPFKDHKENVALAIAVKDGLRETLPDDTPPTYRQWVERCWNKEPQERPEAKEMVVDDDVPAASSDVGGSGSTLSLS